jgi:hypothetical protein
MIAFLLSNFTLTFTVIGLLAAVVETMRPRYLKSRTEVQEDVIRWFFFFGIGCSYFYNFVCHVFFGVAIARYIGWAQSPFQAEVGWASLGFSVLGFMAWRENRLLRIGVMAAVSCFMIGAAGGHVIQMLSAHDFAPGNAGGIFWSDLLLPLFGWTLLILGKSSPAQEEKGI